MAPRFGRQASTQSPPVEMFKPVPHPAGECPFYRGGWQNFLVAMQPDATGKPALVTRLPDHRQMLHAPSTHRPAALVSGRHQAGRRARRSWSTRTATRSTTASHVNQAFKRLHSPEQAGDAGRAPQLPDDAPEPDSSRPASSSSSRPGRSSRATPPTIAEQTKDYISMKTTVPTLSQDPVTGSRSTRIATSRSR